MDRWQLFNLLRKSLTGELQLGDIATEIMAMEETELKEAVIEFLILAKRSAKAC